MGVDEDYYFAGGMGGRVVLPCMMAFHSWPCIAEAAYFATDSGTRLS